MAAGVDIVPSVPGVPGVPGVSGVSGVSGVTAISAVSTMASAVSTMASAVAMTGMPPRMREPTEGHRDQTGGTGHEGDAVVIHMLDDTIRPDCPTGVKGAWRPRVSGDQGAS
jgi:hypothetical protein